MKFGPYGLGKTRFPIHEEPLDAGYSAMILVGTAATIGALRHPLSP
jgi:hypothetical protein